MRILAGPERFLSKIGDMRVMLPEGILFWAECIWVVDGLVVLDELVMPIATKVRDPFLHIRKKIGLTLSLEARKRPTTKKRAPAPDVKAPSPVVSLHQSKGQGEVNLLIQNEWSE